MSPTSATTPQTLTTMGQFLFDDKGQRFATSAAILSLTGADKFFLKNINPGTKVMRRPTAVRNAPRNQDRQHRAARLHDLDRREGEAVLIRLASPLGSPLAQHPDRVGNPPLPGSHPSW